MTSSDSQHSMNSSVSNNAPSTSSTPPSMSDMEKSRPWANPTKRYFLYIHKYPEPLFPLWAFCPAFYSLRQQLRVSFRERFEHFVKLTGDKLAEEHDFNVIWLGWEQTEHYLKEQLERSFPGYEVAKEYVECARDDFWPKDFSDRVTMLSVSEVGMAWNWDGRKGGDFNSCAVGKQPIPKGGFFPWEKYQVERRTEDKLVEGKKNSKAWNKMWRCCKCTAQNPSERPACENSPKDPDCHHTHCERCPDGGNFLSDAVLD